MWEIPQECIDQSERIKELEAQLAAAQDSARTYQHRADRLQRTIDGLENADMAELVDALDHIARACRASRTQTRRIRWIEHRAKCALEGGDWRDVDLPKMGGQR